MNGARSTFIRKGYWLTALATAVLLAASSGTAWAQIEIESVKVAAANSRGEVNEGVTTSVTVALTDDVPSGRIATIMLAVSVPDVDSDPNNDDGGKTGNAETAANGRDLVLANDTLLINGGDDTGSMTLLVAPDLDAVNENFIITASFATDQVDDGFTNTMYVEADDAKRSGKVIDDEPQTYVFDVETTEDDILEGDDFQVTLEAKPDRPANEAVVLFLRAPTGYTFSTTEFDKDMLTSGGLPLGDDETDQVVGARTGTHPDEQTLTVTVRGNDKNRTDDVIRLEALSGNVASNEVVGTSDPITVLDIHQLPTDISGEANGVDEDGKETNVVTMVAEGGKANLYVTVVNEDDDRISDTDAENFTVTPTLSGSQVLDARIMPTYLDVMEDDEESGSSGNYVVGPFTLEAVNDEDIGPETLMVSLDVTGDNAYGSGTSSGTFSIDVTDMTAPLVFVKDGAYEAIMMALGDAVTQGSVVTIMTDEMFGMDEGYNASFGTSVEGDSISASASGDRVTLTASSDATGESKVTVTATARMESSSFIPSQTVSNVAEITFPVTVVEGAPDPDPEPEATPLVVTLSADPMEIEAGGMSTITATADRAVTADDDVVTIDLTVEGDGTLDADSITIAMGEMSGSVTLTANESVTVEATGSGITTPMQVMVTVTDAPPDGGPEPVPALPLIAQWLLGLGLMGGGARQLFRRRSQSQGE